MTTVHGRWPSDRTVQVNFAYWVALQNEVLEPGPALHHPLPAMLDALREGGSIKAAAKALGHSYRHVWGELRRWEQAFGQPLIQKVKGQRAQLTPFGECLLGQEREIQARFAAHLDALRSELEKVFGNE